MITIKTTKLRNNQTVLAKETKFGLDAVKYCNDTQALKKAMQLKSEGIDCYVYQTPGNAVVRFIAIK